jgi:hypothetical protein
MTTSQIEELFFKVIEEKAIYNKLEGISRNTVFNWLNKRTIPTMGDMLGVLYQLKHIEVEKKILYPRDSRIFIDGKEMKSMSFNDEIKAGDYTHTLTIPNTAFGGDLNLPPEIEEKLIE